MRRCRTFGLSILAILCLAAPTQAQFQSVRVQVVDRGQADGFLIRTPNQRWVVIDAGQDRLQAEGTQDEWGVDSVACPSSRTATSTPTAGWTMC